MSDARARMLKLAERLFTGGEVTSRWIREQFGVSVHTAKRDLVILEQQLGVDVRFDRPAGNFSRKVLRLRGGA